MTPERFQARHYKKLFLGILQRTSFLYIAEIYTLLSRFCLPLQIPETSALRNYFFLRLWKSCVSAGKRERAANAGWVLSGSHGGSVFLLACRTFFGDFLLGGLAAREGDMYFVR